MPVAFQGTAGEPDMALAIAKKDPKYVTRKKLRRNFANAHSDPAISVDDVLQQGALMHAWIDPVHGSRNELYKVPERMAGLTNVCIRCANDPSIVWRYESNGPRQSARAYVPQRAPGDPLSTRYVRVAKPWGKAVRHTKFIHPDIATALIAGDACIPPGDVVARWNQAEMKHNVTEAARIHGILRTGQPICAYFLQ